MKHTFQSFLRKTTDLITKYRKALFLFIVASGIFLCSTLASIFLFHFLMTKMYANQTFAFTNLSHVPEAKTALILGAGVRPDGTPSDILHDRVSAGVALYKAGKVKKLIVSGDNRFSHYNEPEVMEKLAISLGVPEEDVQPDFAGRRTYDSCWRAKHIFGQNEVVVVTQSFHMTRSLFLCNQLGIKTTGLVADGATSRWYYPGDWRRWQVRDIFALPLSVMDVYLKNPDVVKGEKIEM